MRTSYSAGSSAASSRGCSKKTSVATAKNSPGFVAPYATLPVVDGALALGTWQSVCLVDTNVDNPVRQVRLSFLAG